jgi:hypothetical protein
MSLLLPTPSLTDNEVRIARRMVSAMFNAGFRVRSGEIAFVDEPISTSGVKS